MSCYHSNELLALEQALQILLSSTTKLPETETVPISAALDRIIAVNIHSPHDIPNYDNSAMDGYAFNCDISDSRKALKLVGKSFAGEAFQGEVKAGECIRIMTGAKVPKSCNAVVMQENTQANGDAISFKHTASAGENIRPAGNDLKKDSLIFEQGKHINALDIGILASLGLTEVCVFKKIRVAIFSTGDEIIALGEAPKEGFIYDSNRYLLLATLQRLNLDVKDYGVLKDDPNAIEKTFIEASQSCDAIISSGGVSVGEADFTRDILGKLGDISFYKLAIKPGKPFAFGTIGPAHFFGLPGNPVSAAVTFHQLAIPALRSMAGEKLPPTITIKANSCSRLKKRAGRIDFQRGRLFISGDGSLCVESTGRQSSGALSSMVKANCYIKLAAEQGNVERGETVDVVPFDRYFC